MEGEGEEARQRVGEDFRERRPRESKMNLKSSWFSHLFDWGINRVWDGGYGYVFLLILAFAQTRTNAHLVRPLFNPKLFQ